MSGPEKPLSPEMKAWIEFLGGGGNNTKASKARNVPRKVTASWSYPFSITSAPFGGGSGVYWSPYIISTPQHLANLAYMVNQGSTFTGVYFKMANDIVLNNNVLKKDGSLGTGNYQAWTPIGDSGNAFKGVFNGDGHHVSGIYINEPSKNYQGLFGRAADGEILNLGVEDSYICGYDYVAGIVGHSDHASVSNCYNAATVVAHFDVGGIVGDDCGKGGSNFTIDSNSITACANYGLVTASMGCVGGIIGYGSSKVNVNYCINYAKVTGTGNRTGGILGESGLALSCSANTGTIVITDTETNYGAISGGSGTGVTNCYYLSETCTKAGGGTAMTATEFADGTVMDLIDPAGNYFEQGDDGLPALMNINIDTSDHGNTLDGIEMINLGLPSGTLWANMNVGATEVTETGDYYGWGGLTANSTAYSTATSYSSDIDAATSCWGNNWQMPSEEQLQELIDQCTWTYVTNYQDVNITGMELTGPNGNKLFLPTTGLEGNDNGWGYYWSSTVVSSTSAKSLAFKNGESTATIYQDKAKNNGYMIRPVYIGPAIVESTDISTLDYAVYASDANGRKNSQMTLTVNMKNSQPITLWQADLTLPSGFAVAHDNYGDPMISLSTQRTSTSRHSIASSTLADGSIRILCSSNSNKTFTGTDGEVATITLDVDGSIDNGEYAVKLKNIILVETDETKHEVGEVESKITIKNFNLGDVNDDGSIDGVDLVGIVNYILETPKAGNILEAADVNQDGVIDGSDYVREVNIILGNITLPVSGEAHGIADEGDLLVPSAPAKAAKRNSEATDDYAFYANDVESDAGGQPTLNILMKNAQPITLWQADLVLPEGVSIATDDFGDPMVEITGRTTATRHSIATSTLADGSIRILCSSNSNKTFTGNDGEVAEITLMVDGSVESGEYPIVLRNILLVEADEAKHNCSTMEYTISVDNTDASVESIKTPSENVDCQIFGINGIRRNHTGNTINIVVSRPTKGGKPEVRKVIGVGNNR